MSMPLDSLEATSMAATPPSPESGEEAGGKRLKLESKPQPQPQPQPKPKPLPWELKDPEDLELSDMYVCDDNPFPILFCNKRFVYKNKAMLANEKAIAEYKERSRNLTPWDAIAVPYQLGLCGGIRPYTITDDVRPRLIHFCNLALNKYNADNQGANFVFDDLVKSTKSVAGYMYYITFKAKDASNKVNPSTFQAKVWAKGNPKVAEPEVKLVQMKTT